MMKLLFYFILMVITLLQVVKVDAGSKGWQLYLNSLASCISNAPLFTSFAGNTSIQRQLCLEDQYHQYLRVTNNRDDLKNMCGIKMLNTSSIQEHLLSHITSKNDPQYFAFIGDSFSLIMFQHWTTIIGASLDPQAPYDHSQLVCCWRRSSSGSGSAGSSEIKCIHHWQQQHYNNSIVSHMTSAKNAHSSGGSDGSGSDDEFLYCSSYSHEYTYTHMLSNIKELSEIVNLADLIMMNNGLHEVPVISSEYFYTDDRSGSGSGDDGSSVSKQHMKEYLDTATTVITTLDLGLKKRIHYDRKPLLFYMLSTVNNIQWKSEENDGGGWAKEKDLARQGAGKLVRKFDDIIYERKIFCEVASIMNNEVSKIISGGSGGSGGVENMNIMLIDQLKFNHQCTTTSTVSEVDTHEFYGSGYDGSLGWTTSEQKFEMYNPPHFCPNYFLYITRMMSHAFVKYMEG